MRVALAQMNSTLGDFAGNRDKMLSLCHKAILDECDLIVFPEASLFGYHPVDLLERPSIVKEQLKELKAFQQKMPKGLVALVGAITINPKQDGKPYFNSAVLMERGKKPKVFAKQLLPTYDVFDEGRHIEPGALKNNIFRFKGHKVLVTVCEDIWAWPLKKHHGSNYAKNPIKEMRSRDVDLVINLSASPFTDKKLKSRRFVTKKTAEHLKAPLIYVNLVGAQDEIIFDGGSFVTEPKGGVSLQLPRFEESYAVYDTKLKTQSHLHKVDSNVNELRRKAIVLGIKDFAAKVGLQKAHLGLSGGIDSAVVACLAAEALGPENVTAVAMPGPYSTGESLRLAKELADNLKMKIFEVGIDHSYKNILGDLKNWMPTDSITVAHENLQARLRMVVLMSFSNVHGSLLLNTSNKSEMATGYSTLYGDMSGGLSPIGDLLKTEVYELARYYNQLGSFIPESIISRPPSAELRPNQTDQDSLPPYSELDPAVEKLVENYRSPKSTLDHRVLQLMMKSEFKRWQAPPILKVSDHAFGRGRRLPLAHKAWY
ncbi:MAG: NAD+ synthase [Pseudobdellovibrionaceae bacterium]|nr:NAD+ synthase [Bdellovibrionales bacterium]USN46957.1 MAG: NAD+ synthase [Pseudobdellovibrionaceae bacterium]